MNDSEKIPVMPKEGNNSLWSNPLVIITIIIVLALVVFAFIGWQVDQREGEEVSNNELTEEELEFVNREIDPSFFEAEYSEEESEFIDRDMDSLEEDNEEESEF